MTHPALRFVAEVSVEPHPDGAVASVGLSPVDEDALIELQNRLVASHVYLGRARVSGPGGTGTVERWCGSEWEVHGEDLINDLPSFVRMLVPAGPIDVDIALRLELPGDRGSMVVELRGQGTVAPPFSATSLIALTEAPLEGAPFAAPFFTDTPAAVGPPLPHPAVPQRAGTRGPCAVLPDVGILVTGPGDRVALIAPDGIHDLPRFPRIAYSPDYERVLTAGPGGALAMIWGDSREPTLSLFGPPDLAHIGNVPAPFGEWFTAVDGCFDATGTLLMLPVRSHLGAIDVRRRAFRWRAPHSDAADSALDVTTSTVIVAGRGEWLELDLASGAERHCAWLPDPDTRGTIAGAAAAPRRFAWAQTLRINPPLGLVAWHDVAAGRGGQVAVPDDFSDLRVAVLDDGRIVAAGRSTWLVDPGTAPGTGSAARIAAGVPLPRRPLVTHGPNGHRLWTLDPQRWYLEIPS